MRTITLASLALLVSFAPSRAGQVDLTTCNQSVPERALATLTADLDCSAGPQDLRMIYLGHGATLALNGHVLRGAKVVCLDTRCGIVGPGAIDIGAGSCLGFDADGQWKLRNMSLTNCEGHGVESAKKVDLKNVSITGCGAAGILNATDVRAMNVTVANNGWWGIDGRSVRGKNVTATGNGFGQAIGSGISGTTVLLTGATVTGNNGLGVAVDGRLKIAGGTVTGNGIDIASPTFPRLSATTCDSSLNAFVDPPVTWGVCAND